MTVAREIFGTWDTPDGESVEGRLRVDDDGRITLELRRALPEAVLPLPLLRGRLGDGAPVTLLGIDILRHDPGADHYVQQHLVSTAVLGLDLPGPDAPVLWRGEARIAGLERVVGRSGLSLETSDIARREDAFAKVEWRQSDQLDVPLSAGGLVLVDHVRFEHSSWFRFALEHRVLARYSAEGKAISLERLGEIVEILCAFVSFAVEARVSIDSLLLTGASGGPGAECLINYRPHHGPPLEEAEPWLILDGLADPAAAIAGFYRFHDEQPSAYLILFEYLIFAAQLNSIDKLLYLARFLEVYHRTRFGSDTMAFHRRVVELLAGPAALTAEILGSPPDEFAELLRDCRNYWTHYDPKLAARVLRDQALDDFDDRVLLVLRACLLDHIGVPSPEARTCLEADWRCQRLAGTPLERPA